MSTQALGKLIWTKLCLTRRYDFCWKYIWKHTTKWESWPGVIQMLYARCTTSGPKYVIVTLITLKVESTYVRHFFNTSLERGRVSKLRELEFFPWVLGFFLEFWGFPLSFWRFYHYERFFLDLLKFFLKNSKMFPFLKIFGNKNGIFRCTPGNFAKRWVFFLSFYKLE